MIISTINTDSNISKPITFLVILYPLLSAYGMMQVTLGMVCMFLYLAYSILRNRNFGMQWPKYFWLFFVYMVMSRFLNIAEFSITSLFSLNLFSFAILLGFSCKYFNLQYGIKIYEIVVLCCCIFFFMQEAMILVVGYRVVGLLPWIPLNTGMSSRDYIAMITYYPRSASFFLEPAHFAQYIIPLLAIELFKTQRTRWTNFYIILISVVVIFLKSGTGALVMALIWTTWGFYYMRNSKLYKKLLLLFLMGPVIVFGALYYLKSEMGKELTERSAEFNEVSSTTSAYVRIIRGFDLFADMPAVNKCFGLNSPAKIKQYVSMGSMYSLFLEDDLAFSGIQSILIYGGICGMLLFLLHFNYLFRKNNIEGRMLGVAFIGLTIISPIYLMGEMLLSYTIMYAFQQQYLLNENLISENVLLPA